MRAKGQTDREAQSRGEREGERRDGGEKKEGIRIERGAYRKRETQSRLRTFFFLMERTKRGPSELQNG